MAPLSLKIILDDGAVTRKVMFESTATVRQAAEIVKEKVIVPDEGKEYALFLRSADNELSGIWLDEARNLDYYMLRDGDALDYICKMRNLRVRMLDGAVKTMKVDQKKSIGNLMVDICTRIGITNYDEYGLCYEGVSEKDDRKELTGTLTLKRKAHKERDPTLEEMSKRLKTDDNVEWLDSHSTLRELGVEMDATLLLKRRLFFSDRNVNARDPVELNLLYVQTRDAIHNGRHPVTEDQAAIFAGIQCQVQFGDFVEDKHKPGFIENLAEYLPEQYCNSWGVERKIYKAFKTYQGQSALDAKYTYIKTARELPTYGVTFFLVKEKQKGKKKLIPRLLGISAESILRLDHDTKEILQSWPLTHVKTYHTGKTEMFTLNFGEYSDKEYSVKTQDAYRIRDILEGYIDIIRRRMFAKPAGDGTESMVICHDNVNTGQAHVMQHISQNPTKMVTDMIVGPQRIVPYDQGQTAQHGTQIMTVQNIIVSNRGQPQQQALKGELPLRGDMSMDCARKLNRMNSSSVKIVNLLTEVNDDNMTEAQKIVGTMRDDLPIVQQGIKETAEKQTMDDSRKMLLNELDELNNYMKQLEQFLQPETTDTEGAKEAAENIAGLTTQICFSLDNKIRNRNDILRRSRKSFIEDEKTMSSIRRGSFIAAAHTAQKAVENANKLLTEVYSGPPIDDAEKQRLEKSLEDKIGKLNAALALYLTAHSDPQNIDYATAINSMNTINELMPQLASDAQKYASSMSPESRKQLLSEMRALLEAANKICNISNSEDKERIQDEANNYSGIAGQLIFTFSRGKNADKENEIIDLAKIVAAKTSVLLVNANELTNECPEAPDAGALDDAGVRAAHAARDLLACAQLTAPAISEPHCRSALTAAAENISSSVSQLETCCKPLLELQPDRGGHIHASVSDVHKAVQRLKDAFEGLDDNIDGDDTSQQKELHRLKFIQTITGAKQKLQGVEDQWGKCTQATTPQQQQLAQQQLQQHLARLNAAIAALTAATADRDNMDYETAAKAMHTISDLLPLIMKEGEIVTHGQDDATKASMLEYLRSICDHTRSICDAAEEQQGLTNAAAKYAAVSNKLTFLLSPGADRTKEDHIMDLTASACAQASVLLSNVQAVTEQLPAELATLLDEKGARTADAAQALLSIAQVSAPHITEPEASKAIISSASRLQSSSADLVASCQTCPPDMVENLMSNQKKLEECLNALVDACPVNEGLSPKEKRLQFIRSASSAKNNLTAALQELDKPTSPSSPQQQQLAQQQLQQHLARLNAAIAALTAATADRDNMNYETAEKAMHTISELLPLIMNEGEITTHGQDDATKASMLEYLRSICDHTRSICDAAEDQQGLSNAAAEYAAASNKLTFLLSPGADRSKEDHIMDLTASACAQASVLLSNVQAVTEQLPAELATLLDEKGARTADAAQALLSIAQVSAPHITEPEASKAIISSASRLQSSSTDLVASCQTCPPDMVENLMSNQKKLEECLNALVDACPVNEGLSPKEKRLQFIRSASSAKNNLTAALQELDEPAICQLMRPEDSAKLERELWQRLAELYAAIALLEGARSETNYGNATKAVNNIKELMPLVVRDAKTLCGSKDDAVQKQLLQQLRELCEASCLLCDSDDTEGMNNAAAKFGASSKKLVFLISPPGDKAKEKQIRELSSSAMTQASSLSSSLRSASTSLQEPECAELLHRADTLMDAANRLRGLSEVLAPTIQDESNNSLLTAIAQLHSAATLPEQYTVPQEVRDKRQMLKETLEKLARVCNARQVEVPDSTSRRVLLDRALHARDSLSATRRMSVEPLLCQLMKEEDGARLHSQLYQRLAQLAAAVASLEAGNTDSDKPNYLEAVKSITEIKDLTPLVVKDARTLCGTKSEAEQAALLQQIKELCDATSDICSHADDPKGLTEAANKFKNVSKKLVFLISPAADPNKEIHITGLTTAIHREASTLAAELHQAANNTDGEISTELSAKADKVVDAANRLQAVAEVLSPALQEAECSSDLQAAVSAVRTAAALPASLSLSLSLPPHVQDTLAQSTQQLDLYLNQLEAVCQVPSDRRSIILSPEEKKHRVKFMRSVSVIKNNLQAAENELKQPLMLTPMDPSEVGPLQQQLTARRSRLDDAIAALNAALLGQKNRNYPHVEAALQDIMELMPLVVQDARKLVAAEKAPVDVLVDVGTKCKTVQKLLHKVKGEKIHDSEGELASPVNKSAPPLPTKPVVVEKKVKPPVPARKISEHDQKQEITEDFINRIREEELREREAREKALEKQQVIDKFSDAIDSSTAQLQAVQDMLQKVPSKPSALTPAVEVATREQRMEDNLAAAGVHVAALVAANYADQLDYEAALRPTEEMTHRVKQVVEDGAVLSESLQDNARSKFLADMLGLCEASKNICDAAKSDKKKLNEAAIKFGDQSAKLLKVVSSDVNPELEREVIHKAKAIGDTASRIAMEAGNIVADSHEEQNYVREICNTGAKCVDAAGKLVYTAKLVSPSIGHKICQEALVSSADNLHSSVETFSKTWQSISSNTKSENMRKLSEELEKLQKLLLGLKNDVRRGRFGSREVERDVIIDTPLREMTLQVIENAKNMSQLSELSPELRQQYAEYSERLKTSLHAVDVASARSQRAPRDNMKRDQMEMAIQDLQMNLLQTRPSRSGQPHSDIVDFRDFLQDMSTKAEELQRTAKQYRGAIVKHDSGADDPITVLCSKMLEESRKLLYPDELQQTTVMTSEDDVAQIDQFGQESDVMLKEINATINGVQDAKAKGALKAHALSLYESCQLLRFAVNSHIAATKSVAFDEALLDLHNYEKDILKPLAANVMQKKQAQHGSTSSTSSSAALSDALREARGGAPARVVRALTRHVATTLAGTTEPKDVILENLVDLINGVQQVTRAQSFRIANWGPTHTDSSDAQIYKKLYANSSKKPKHSIVSEEDLDKLLSCELVRVEGSRMQLEEKLQQLSSKLSSMYSTILASTKNPETLARSLHVAADAAGQLTHVARSLKDEKRPVQSRRIEEACDSLSLATCDMLRHAEATCDMLRHAEATCEQPAHASRLLDACQKLNDCISQLERCTLPSTSSRIAAECGAVQRCLSLQRCRTRAAPAAALPYQHVLDSLASQTDVFNKLQSSENMSRDQFASSLRYLTSAVNNTADCASHATYLLSLSEQDLEAAKQGLVDVPKLRKGVAAVQDSCVNIIMDLKTDHYEHDMPEKKKQLEQEVTNLAKDLDEAVEKTKDQKLKTLLKECRNDLDASARSFYVVVQTKGTKESLMTSITTLMYEVNYVSSVVELPGLVPAVGNVSSDTQQKCDEIAKCTTDLLSSTQDLMKEVKSSQHPDVMTWVVFNKRKNVLEAFDALIKSVRLNGHRVNIIEGGLDDDEDNNKSYIQTQVDLACKWLQKPTNKADVKTNGQQAVRNIIDLAHKTQKELKDNEDDEMSALIAETEQVFSVCCNKYDHEQYSLLIERIKELQKVIERVIVTRVVEDFMEAEAPLDDLDILADAETDAAKRKFILERKIAELLAHLGRISKTARLIAHTGSGGLKLSAELKTCSEQTELLAPMLVKAAQLRIQAPHDEVAIENYKKLLAQYAESMSKVRDLCDQSVDPIDFVQTASVTMQRMRDESSQHNDPLKCAYTSTVITRLANRVIQVGLSSSTARADPSLQHALCAAQVQLHAATPDPGTRASRMPDWKDTTAMIIRATDEVESVLGGESIFKKQPEPDQPIYNEALNLHVAIRDWSSRDNEIVAVAKRMAVLMAKLSDFMKNDKQRDVLTTSKSIVAESHEVARLAKKLAHECTDHRIKTNLLQACERIPTISGQLKMLTTVKGSSLGHHGTKEDKEAMDMLVGNAQSLMTSISDVVKGAASASVKIMSQRGPRIKWVRKTYY